MAADLFHGLEDRLTPAAYIPMRTPKDAIDELEFVVKKLGLKAVMMESLIRRPIKSEQKYGEPNRHASWTDALGLESEYDYDSVWAKCVEVNAPPTFPTASLRILTRLSNTNSRY